MSEDNDHRPSNRPNHSYRPHGSASDPSDRNGADSMSASGGDDHSVSREYERETPSESSGRHRSRHRTRRKSSSASELYKCKRGLALFKGSFVLILIVAVIGVLFLRGYVSRLEDDLAAHTHKIKELRDGHASWQERVDQLERDLASHVTGKLPDLNPLTYDKVIEVDQQYVKNLVFSVSRKADTTSYEYQLVMHNRSPIVIQPRVKILLFDRNGLQIGISDLKGLKDNVLIPEETRSLHEVFEILLEDREPAYFMIITK